MLTHFCISNLWKNIFACPRITERIVRGIRISDSRKADSHLPSYSQCAVSISNPKSRSQNESGKEKPEDVYALDFPIRKMWNTRRGFALEKSFDDVCVGWMVGWRADWYRCRRNNQGESMAQTTGIHIVIDFNAFHCWCHVPGFISSMYNDAIASISISPSLIFSSSSFLSFWQRATLCQERGYEGGGGSPERRSDCTLLRFQTHYPYHPFVHAPSEMRAWYG